VKSVESIVDSDLGFVQTNEIKCEKTSYLFIRKKRVLGMVTAEHITEAFVLESCSERSTESLKAMVGIHKIWVHQKCRKEGIASMLIDTVRSKFVYGLVVPAEMIAFSSPTVAGMGLAGHYLATVSGEIDPNILVYDCAYSS
jgi:N-acetyltransferase